MAQSIFSLLSFTETPILDPEVPVTVPASSVTVTEPETQTTSEAPTELESSQTLPESESPEDIPTTEILEDVPSSQMPEDIESELLSYSETVYETVYMTGEYDEQILLQLQVTNNLLGHFFALQIFLLALFFLVFFIKLLKNNVTNLYT